MNRPIRILLVDDHTLFRESVVRLLEMEPDLQVVGHCATVAEARTLLEAADPDVVLLDYDLGGEAGTDLVRDLEARGELSRVLVVTAGMRQSVALEWLQSGVSGILLKHSPPARLLDAIRRVAGGEIYLDKKVTTAVDFDSGREATPEASLRSFTTRQRAVLGGILDGLTNKEIAVRLDTSESAIKAVIQELFRKAGVRTRAQLVRIAIEKSGIN
jgi:two-component system, NarL family, nitrate/nitrite response regulator NarL